MDNDSVSGREDRSNNSLDHLYTTRFQVYPKEITRHLPIHESVLSYLVGILVFANDPTTATYTPATVCHVTTFAPQ